MFLTKTYSLKVHRYLYYFSQLLMPTENLKGHGEGKNFEMEEILFVNAFAFA